MDCIKGLAALALMFVGAVVGLLFLAHKCEDLEKKIIVIETVLIMKGIIPESLERK